MNCRDVLSRLDDLVDGARGTSGDDGLREHLARCAACRAEAERMQVVITAAAALPRELAPPRDLWPEIVRRIEGDRVVSIDERRRSGIKPAWYHMVAAAAALVVASALIVGYWAGAREGERVVRGEPSNLSTAARVARAAFGEGGVSFVAAREELLGALAERRTSLSPETYDALMEGVQTLDQSITQIASALEDHPHDDRLARMLASAYRREIDLLQRAALLPPEM